jgi:hypothetical protein
MNEALKLALEAFNVLSMNDYSGYECSKHKTHIIDNAVTAIEAALAQPAKELTNIQRHEQNVQKLFGTAQPADHSEQHLDMVKAQPTSGEYALGYAEGFNDACKPKPAQTAQEPVAWMDEEKKIIYWHNTHETDDYHGFRRTTPLYTTPQQRKPLALYRMVQLTYAIDEDEPATQDELYRLIRSVEAAHGIKESE